MTTSIQNANTLYDADYYRSHCGTIPYERNAHWLSFFGGIADKIIASYGPVRVYDAGCALGFLAEALWDRGVECWGRDISEFAIRNLRPDLRPFCDQGSIAASPPGPGSFDLVTCIEVLEHMEEVEALSALDRLTESAPQVLFSSSPSDFEEITHINVKPVIYWLRQFALRGFAPDWIHNATYLTPHAFVAKRTSRVPLDAELQLFAEWIRIRTALIERERRIGRLEAEAQATTAKLAKAEGDLQAVQQVLAAEQQAKAALLTAEEHGRARGDALLRDLEELRSEESKLALALREASQALAVERERSSVLLAAREQAEARFEGLSQEVEKLRCSVLDGETGNDEAMLVRSNAEAEAHRMRSRLAYSQTEVAALRARLEAIETSSAWRISGPVRRALGRSEAGRLAAKNLMTAAKWSLVWRLPRRLEARNQLRLAARTSVSRPADSGEDRYVPSRVELLNLQAQETQATEELFPARTDVVPYSSWHARQALSDLEIDLQKRVSGQFRLQPLISIIMPVYKVAPAVLEDTIRSALSQTYAHWEFCITLADLSDPVRTDLLVRWSNQDSRIKVKVLDENQGISGNSNAALAMAEGEWIALLDHDDMIPANALYEAVRCINANPEARLIYSDKDHVSGDGIDHHSALFKAGWSPETMLGANYLTHLNIMPTRRVREIGGWDSETDGAQDWDLFLRVIGDSDQVYHIPKVLYHWRQVPTSVASGGFAVKPYAANGQIKALEKYLPMAGWSGASAFFQGPYLRVKWGRLRLPRVSLLLLPVLPGNQQLTCPSFAWAEPVEVVAPAGIAPDGAVPVDTDLSDRGASLDALARAATGDVLVVWQADLLVVSPDWLEELVLPLANPRIAAVAGKVLKSDGRISTFGSFLVDGKVRAGFREQTELVFDIFGSAAWYSNAASAPLCLTAIRRDDWLAAGGCTAQQTRTRSDMALVLQLTRSGRRLLLNPFSVARESTAHSSVVEGIEASDVERAFVQALPNGDPYINPNFTYDRDRWLGLRAPPHDCVTDHNFGAEARHHVRAFDADRMLIERSKAMCAVEEGAPLKRILWIVPPFEMPFYGGVHTILRAADYMLREHGVLSHFLCPQEPNPAKVHAAIGKAFPLLAQATTVSGEAPLNDPGAPKQFDAAICTLWTTAFSLLRLECARQKFYFLQDWEPLFYPAGSISGLVETTYRFGFHAISNTVSLAESYKEAGGAAEYFMPAIDATVFFPRHPTQPSQPFRLFSYMRPAAPRNCFETIGAALQDLKQRHGDSIDIVTAGAPWSPEAYGLSETVRHLGLLPYTETGALYRACDAGLVAMATRHPSYLPLELMACGAAVVTNRNIYTEWLLKDGANAMLCELTRSDMVRAVESLMFNEKLRTMIKINGYQTIQENHQNWDQTCESIYEILRRVVEKTAS